MTKEQFKNKVLSWLKKNNVSLKDKRIRVYKYRGEWEVRIYNEPMELMNMKKSFREDKELTKRINDGRRHGYSGYFKQKITTYEYINETNFKDKNEREFTLDILNNKI
jgi:hypothetical protein